MKPTYEQLQLALSVATSMLFIHEPPDSRAVSNEFVALSAVECGLVDDAVIKTLTDYQHADI